MIRRLARAVTPTPVRDAAHALADLDPLADLDARRAFSDRSSFLAYEWLRYQRLRDKRSKRRGGPHAHVTKVRPPTGLRLVDLGGHALLVRPGSSDVDVVRETFVKRWTLPPAEVG